MKFISWNVNGLRACLKKGFLDFYWEQAPDFICLQETKMEQGQAHVDLDEGTLEYWNSAEKKGYSGTAVFTPHQPLSVAYGMDIDRHDHEGRLITLEYESFYLVCCYTPNSQDGLKRLDYRMEWEDAFREYVRKLQKENILPFRYSKMGRWFGKTTIRDSSASTGLKTAETEIDLLAVSKDEKSYLIGECKFKETPFSYSEYLDTKAKLMPVKENANVYYALFSQSGFSEKLKKEAETDSNVKLYTLEQIVSPHAKNT